jgi:hypothetical protein
MSAMTELEERISTTMRSYGETVVVPPGFSTRVLAGGRRRQQRRRLLSVVVAVATVVVIAGGIAVTKPFATSVPTPAPAAPSPSRALTPLPGVPATPKKLGTLVVGALEAGALPDVPYAVVTATGAELHLADGGGIWKPTRAGAVFQYPIAQVSSTGVVALVADSASARSGTLTFHRPSGDVTLGTVAANGADTITGLAVSRDGSKVAWSASDGIELADLPSGKVSAHLKAPTGKDAPFMRVWSFVGDDVVYSLERSGSTQGSYLRWNPTSGSSTPVLPSSVFGSADHVSDTSMGSISEAADSFVIGENSGTVGDPATSSGTTCTVSYSIGGNGQLRWRVCLPGQAISMPTFSPDGRRVAVPLAAIEAGGKPGTQSVTVLDAANGAVLATRVVELPTGNSLSPVAQWETDGHVVFPYFSDNARRALRCTADLVTCQRTTLDVAALQYGSSAGESVTLPMG